jgi:flavin reductase (DIM6/NTAB) family NADH-FMN oxidoreductase RutF
MSASSDNNALRSALGRFATGVAVVTLTTDQEASIGVTVNSFSSVSLVPPLILFSIDKKARSLNAFRAARSFAINVLGADQQELSRRFARPLDDKWSGVATRPGLDGAPLLDDALAQFECAPWAQYDGGDHTIFVCRVVRYVYDPQKAPLLFYGGRYADLGGDANLNR